MDAPTDIELMRRAQSGDHAAFGELCERHRRALRNAMCQYLPAGRRDEAADVVQDAYLKAWRACAAFRGECAVYTWLYGIARNTALTHCTGALKNAISVGLEYDGRTADSTPEQDVLVAERCRHLRGAINALPRDFRQVLCLDAFENMPQDAIAQAMHCPVATVKTRLHRARARLRDALREDK
jgi:RNA polymerase sigma-70 factor (ECF subfamily)